jgi:hypothetical protein
MFTGIDTDTRALFNTFLSTSSCAEFPFTYEYAIYRSTLDRNVSVAKENVHFMMELEHNISYPTLSACMTHNSLDFPVSLLDREMLELWLIQLRDRRKTHG